jgi:DedD protein
MGTTQDTEITLGTGKMLILFFGLVALCAVFFGMGYSLGRGSSKPDAAEGTAPASAGILRPVARTVPPTDNSAKPSDSTLFKTAERAEANPQGRPAEAKASDTATAPPATDTDKQPAAPDPTAIAYSSSYYVQVAAVSKQEDAEALVDALKKKQYPAFAANGSATDKLYHVQVGPYADIKDAEIMRGKLVSDGYNPILKK